jgi:DNA replication protein DnaC
MARPWRRCWRFWNWKLRTASNDGSADCAVPPGCPLARPVPARLQQQLRELARGDFLEDGVNLLGFGLPGTGKTHARCALGHRLVEAGYSVLFVAAYRLVQELLAARRELQLPRALHKLDNFDFLVLDDLGYLPQGAAASAVLFTLMAERYERRALGITSKLVFSQWDQIFQNPMATAAAIDRVVHHSVILEFDVPSYRTGEARGRQQDEADANYGREGEKRQE